MINEMSDDEKIEMIVESTKLKGMIFPSGRLVH